MQISGFIDYARYREPYVIATVQVPELKLEENIKFLVDTGSPYTIISDSDAEALGIDTYILETLKEPGLGLGGFVEFYRLDNPTLVFITIDEKQYAVKSNFIRIVKRKKEVEEKLPVLYRLPSILGRDFLGKYLVFYANEKNMIIISNETKRLLKEIKTNC